MDTNLKKSFQAMILETLRSDEGKAVLLETLRSPFGLSVVSDLMAQALLGSGSGANGIPIENPDLLPPASTASAAETSPRRRKARDEVPESADNTDYQTKYRRRNRAIVKAEKILEDITELMKSGKTSDDASGHHERARKILDTAKEGAKTDFQKAEIAMKTVEACFEKIQLGMKKDDSSTVSPSPTGPTPAPEPAPQMVDAVEIDTKPVAGALTAEDRKKARAAQDAAVEEAIRRRQQASKETEEHFSPNAAIEPEPALDPSI